MSKAEGEDSIPASKQTNFFPFTAYVIEPSLRTYDEAVQSKSPFLAYAAIGGIICLAREECNSHT